MAFSLVSMALLGTFAYFTSANLLQEISLRQLDALAESKKRDLTKVYESWEDKVKPPTSNSEASETNAILLRSDSVGASTLP